jgi:transposase
MSRTRQRAEWLAHSQHTHSQYHRPESGTKLAYKAHREGVAARFPEPAVQKSLEVDLALLGDYDPRLSDVELHIIKAAKQPDAQTLDLLQPVPGIGTILSLVRLYEMHASQRLPRVQALVAYCRLGKCRQESAGKRSGTTGTKSGNASLQWAFSAAAVLLLRAHPAGQTSRARVEKKHGPGKALTVLAQKVARAVYDRLTRRPAFDRQKFLQT